MYSGIHVLDGSPHASREGAVSGMVSGIFWHCRRIVFNGGNDVLISDQLVCEKLTIFPHADYIVEFCVELAFL